MTIRIRVQHFWRHTVSRKIAWWLPKRVVMWAYYRVIADEPDPDAGTRLKRPIDVVGEWARYHGLKW